MNPAVSHITYHTVPRQEFKFNKTDKTITKFGTAKTQKTRAPTYAPGTSKFDRRRRMPVMNHKPTRRYVEADPTGTSTACVAPATLRAFVCVRTHHMPDV